MTTASRFVLFTSISFTRQLLMVMLFNAIVALIIYRLVAEAEFIFNLIISELIGLSVFSCLHAVYRIRFYYSKRNNTRFSFTLLALVLGSIMGVLFASTFVILMIDISAADFMIKHYDNIIQNVLFGLIFGAVIIHYLMSHESLSKATSELQKHKLSIVENEKTIIESQLKLLQSQIEPHFLFNTLSNIIGLIDREPARSKIMLESLTHYLRATVDYTRRDSAVIEDEIKMISAYLDIFKERMGARLQYEIDVDQELYNLPLSPMLLQPIVENAIKHGLEPKLEGGFIQITGNYNNNKIIFNIEDNGCGIEQESGDGVGLTNVQQRLKAMYGDRAAITLQNIKPRGLRVSIEIPC